MIMENLERKKVLWEIKKSDAVLNVENTARSVHANRPSNCERIPIVSFYFSR